MTTNFSELQDRLDARFARAKALPRSDIAQILGALDSPHSNYAGWPAETRAAERARWLPLAKHKAPRRPAAAVALSGVLAGLESRLPRRPYCVDSLPGRVRPEGWATAASRAYVQINAPAIENFLVIDCDHDQVDLWQRKSLPPPTWIAVTPATGRHHAVYGLEAGICKTMSGRAAPLRYFAAVQEAYRQALHGDPGYADVLTKNPLHQAWRTLTTGPEIRLYSLADLAECVTLPRTPKKDRAAARAGGAGRNCTLFDELRFWAYATVREFECPATWRAAVDERAAQLNLFTTPLPGAEVKAIAKSVAKYVWMKSDDFSLNSADFIARQAARGRKSGEARRASSEQDRCAARLLKSQGRSIREIAAALGKPRSTVGEWLV